jgi:hypothetical protein
LKSIIPQIQRDLKTEKPILREEKACIYGEELTDKKLQEEFRITQ